MPKFNFAELRENDRELWVDLTDTSLSFPQIIRQLLPQFVWFKNDIFYDIICSYIITPSTLSNYLPFLASIGVSGCGKSTVGKFATVIYGENQHNDLIFGGDTTYAHLRREISKFIFPYEEGEEDEEKIEENVLVAWDDIDLKILKSEQFFRWLKCSYDRLTARTGFVESSKDKKKATSNFSFCLKCLSSTLPLWEFEEIKRRLLVIPCSQGDVSHLLKVEHYDWTGINQMYLEYWMKNAEQLMQLKRKTRSALRSMDIADDIKTTVLDVVNVGNHTGILTKDKLQEYFSATKQFMNQTDVFGQAMQLFLKNTSKISCNEVREHQINLYRKGILTREQSTVETLKTKMYSFGYKIKGFNWIKEEEQSELSN